jgi:GR25 family glycosyltransferase involved in LPS biosynthesis
MLILINLDSAHDRRNFMTSQLASVGIDFTRVGVDMRNQSRKFIFDWVKAHFPQFTFDLRALSGAEIGCWLSHLSAWRQVLAMDRIQTCIVIEDDARLRADFADAAAALNVDLDYDVIYLGTSSRNLSQRRRMQIGRFWVHEPVGVVYNTWGYSIARKYIERLFDAGKSNITVPIDHFLGGTAREAGPRISVLVPAVLEEDPVLGRSSQIGPHTRRLDRWQPVETARRRLVSSHIGNLYYSLYRFL